MMKHRILLLHDVCTVGRAAAMNMIPVLNSMGVETCLLPTVMLSTHTGGFGKPAIQYVSPEYIKNCGEHFAEQNITFDAIFIGYLGTPEMVDAVLHFLSFYPDTRVILDPIFGDNGRVYSHFNNDYIEKLKTLFPFTDILLPNLTEVSILADAIYDENASDEELDKLCKILVSAGVKEIVITGKGIYTNEQFKRLQFSMLDVSCHGTGDLFDGVFVGHYLKGKNIMECTKEAHTFVYQCIEDSIKSDFDTKEGVLFEKNLHRLV